MTTRVSMTLAICTLSAGIAAVGLARPASWSSTEAAPQTPGGESAAPGYGSGSGSGSNEATSPAVPATGALDQLAIQIQDFAFDGATSAPPGAVLTVTNADGVPHTLTAVDGVFDTGTIDGGGSAALTLPAEPGTYQFFCAIHPSMTGTVTVRP